MKKNKSKQLLAGKQLRKAPETKLLASFTEVVQDFGKAKKADKLIEKVAKQLAKKVTIVTKDDSITPFIKEDVVVPTEKKTKTAKPAATKTAVKKTNPEVKKAKV